MKLLNRIAYNLRQYPKFKRFLKTTYKNIGNILSNKKTFPKDITQVSSDSEEHLFGYYDKSPWNKNEDKMLYLEVKNASKYAASTEKAKIILKDLNTNEEQIIAETSAWNVQQSCRLQWIGPDFNSRILYNDFIEGKLKTVILDINDNTKRIIDSPIYDVDKNGKFGLTLDFYRLHRLRPGYGYKNKEDKTKDELIPDGYCIWKVDLEKNKKNGIITYKELFDLDNKNSMIDAEHKVNHIMINPSGTRFMFLHRWIKNGVKNTRLLTADIDGKNIYNLLDNGMVSHCNWKNDNKILGWAREDNSFTCYLLLKDKSHKITEIAKEDLTVDGHPSYSYDGKYFITDTYPDFKRKQNIYLYNVKTKQTVKIASIYANTKYDEDCRCDLHPRWNYSGNKICFDGAQKNKRQVYTIDISNYIDD